MGELAATGFVGETASAAGLTDSDGAAALEDAGAGELAATGFVGETAGAAGLAAGDGAGEAAGEVAVLGCGGFTAGDAAGEVDASGLAPGALWSSAGARLPMFERSGPSRIFPRRAGRSKM